MSTLERIKNHFEDSIKAKQAALLQMPETIEQAGALMSQALASGHKILVCGNGGSAADAQHFAAELINRFEMERPSLPALALTTDSSALTSIANDYHYHQIFSKQVEGLGQKGDVLLAISTSGQSENINKAIEVAIAKGLRVVALTGKDGGKIPPILSNNDIELRVPAQKTSRVQECHIVIIHALCDYIDNQLYGDKS